MTFVFAKYLIAASLLIVTTAYSANSINQNQFVENEQLVSNSINIANNSINDFSKEVLIANLKDIVTTDKYITSKDGNDCAEFINYDAQNYTNGVLRNLIRLQYKNEMTNNKKLLNRDAYKNVINTIPRIKAKALMNFSLIFNWLFYNNQSNQSQMSHRYDNLKIFRIFNNINSGIRNKINKCYYKLDLNIEFFNMIIAQYFELVFNDKIKDCNGIVNFTPVIDLICTKVNNTKALERNIFDISNNSDKLQYNIESLAKIIEGNDKLANNEKQKYLDEISYIDSKRHIDSWNKMVDFIHQCNKPITAKYGTDKYWAEYYNTNPLVKTLKQAVILFNEIFN